MAAGVVAVRSRSAMRATRSRLARVVSVCFITSGSRLRSQSIASPSSTGFMMLVASMKMRALEV